MPEDLEDKIIDFGLMLEGYCLDRPEDKQKTRLLVYWYSLSDEIMEKNNDYRKEKAERRN